MVKVAGIWERGWNTPIKEYDLWRMVVDEFQVDELIMTPVSGINKNVIEMANMQEVIEAYPDLEPVFVDENGETELANFKHPEKALYIFGKGSYSPLHLSQGNLSVKVMTPTNLGLMWPHQVLAILLRDRWLSA